MELAAQRGMNAVAADGDAGNGVSERCTAGVDEAQANARVVARIDADAGVAGDDSLAADPCPHGVEQDGLQIGAVDRQLRRIVAGPAAGRLAVDVLAEAVEERRLARDDGDPLELGEDAERPQRRARRRQHVDADAERPDLRGGLVDAAGDSGLVQRQRQRQAADAGADDGDFPVARPRCAMFGHERRGRATWR